MLGPVEYMVLGFTGNKFNGEIISELENLVDSKLIRILDLLFVSNDKSGGLLVLELKDMPAGVASSFSKYADALSGLLTEDDALELAKGLDKNSSAGVLVYEQLWAKKIQQALMKAGGTLLGSGRIPAADVNAVINELKKEDK